MRFFDHVCFICDATEDKEGHLHSEANGRFVSRTGGASAKAEKPKTKGGLVHAREIFNEHVERLNKGEKPASVVVSMARSLVGSHRCEVPGMGERGVEVGPAFVDECQKHLFKVAPEERKAVAYRQLVGMSHLTEILDANSWTNKSNWRPGGPKHPGEEFNTAFKRLPLKEKGTTLFPVYVVDVKRKAGDVNSKVEAYSLTNSKNKRFGSKGIDPKTVPIEIIDIRCSIG